MPTVVVDAYTGQLIIQSPYESVRGYFVAGLLVISIVVICRLAFVRNNTYTTTVRLHLSSPPSSSAQQQEQGGLRTAGNAFAGLAADRKKEA